ncbi:MAG: hypothetical protein F4X12_08900 [Acidobacteriia bacterium]|nr:hypothetical protein [Terriglobia bacterium]
MSGTVAGSTFGSSRRDLHMDSHDIDVVVLLVPNRRREVSKQPERSLVLYRSIVAQISEHD